MGLVLSPREGRALLRGRDLRKNEEAIQRVDETQAAAIQKGQPQVIAAATPQAAVQSLCRHWPRAAGELNMRILSRPRDVDQLGDDGRDISGGETDHRAAIIQQPVGASATIM